MGTCNGMMGSSILPLHDAAHRKSIKCVSAFKNNAIVDISGTCTWPELQVRLPKYSIHLQMLTSTSLMITQNPSESSITITVRKIDADKTVQAIEKSLLGKIIKNIDVTSNVTIVALIGAGMRGTVGAASKVFGAVAKKSVNVVMITQGSSELNLAFVVRDSDARKAVNAVHNEFKLGN